METDRRRRLINSASLVCCTSQEQINVKRKKVKISPHDMHMRPSISLEWDNKGRSIVPKREQIGLSRRQLMPSLDPAPHSHHILADVCSVPRETFELETLSEVLSYEVWQSHLSESERSILLQFLPKVADPETNVKELLAGYNFHFGNPLQKWGRSLSSGELHPDNVIVREQALKTRKKAYYSGLEKYHNNMIGNLHQLKEKWVSCKDPNVEIVQSAWRFRKHAQLGMPASETIVYDPDENLAGTPESCSSGDSDKGYSSDNQISGLLHGEFPRRNGLMNKTPDITSCGLKDVAGRKKGDKVQKRNIQRGNGFKYMSYVKISKEQHERVKSSIKHIGNSIKPKFLSNVLGSIDTLNVQPFERFEEEEMEKLHKCWFKVATIDMPESFANWRKRQLQIQEIMMLLSSEMEQSLKHEEAVLDDEKTSPGKKPIEQLNDGGDKTHVSIPIEDAEKENSDTLLHDQVNSDESVHDMTPEIEDQDEEGICNDQDETEIKNEYIFVGRTHVGHDTIEDEVVPSHVLVQDRIDQQPPIVSNPLPSSSSDIWPGGDDVPGAYYHHHPTAANGSYNTSSGEELLIGPPHFVHDPSVGIMLDLETTKDVVRVAADVLNSRRQPPQDMSFFTNSYTNEEDRNELLQSFFKGQATIMPFHNQPKHSGLELQPGNDLMMQASQFSGHVKEHHHHLHHDPSSLPIEHQTIQEAVYSNARYAMPHLNSGNLSQNWFTNNAETNVWPASSSSSYDVAVGPNHNSFSSGVNNNNNSDQTLFSVLSECNELRPPVLASYGASMANNTTDHRLLNLGNYSGIIGGGVMPTSSSFLQQQSANNNHLLSYLGGGGGGGHAIVASGNNKINSSNNVGWIGMPPQNSESMGSKQPFVRSWNQ